MSQVRYQPIGPLLAGEGSRAVLGLALEDGAAPCPVVMVWAPPEIVQDAELSALLTRDTQRAVVFEHPNILRVHGLAQLEGGLARVTEYADGEPLRRVLEVGKRLPPPFAALVAADAAMGIHYAHLAGNDDGTPLVHGDVRPETLMLSFGGVCKVSGYGALRVAPKEADGRRVRNRRRYSAPEQLLGGREAINIQTDVFLLGLVLYECLTGKIPFKDSPDPDKATLTRPLPPLSHEVPRALDAVLRKATSKRANERHPSALAFREAIIEAMGGLPTHEAFAAHLAQLFPPDGEVRRARRQVLETGLAEVRRRAGLPAPAPGTLPAPVAGTSPVPTAGTSPVPVATTAPAPAPGTSPVPVAAPPAADAVPVAATTPAAPPPAASAEPKAAAGAPPPASPPRHESSSSRAAPSRAAPRAPRLLVPLAAVGLVLALAVTALLQWGGGKSDPAVEPPDASTALVAEPPDAGATELADAGEPPDAGAPVDAGLAVAPPRVDPGALLELIVDPPVDVAIEGRVLGRTPLSVPLPPGKHVLYLSNAALGIQTARAVNLSATERNLHEVQLRKGFVHVRSPSGAAILMDGRHIGTAPVEQIDIYEGPHRLSATLNGETWEQAFQLEAHQHVTFTVKFPEQ
ncbi:protein kinase [Myxococcaceae bacterium GXIMD 01537]